jgi:hypothetical protein
MKKVPSYLKGLAETRARVAADVVRYQRIKDEVGGSLKDARAELAACDRLIKKFDSRLDPRLIQPIKAWKGRYGDRGALKDAIVQYLKESAPDLVSTTELCWILQNRFQLDFSSPADRRRWVMNTLRAQLKRLVSQGLVERLEIETLQGETQSGWRCKEVGPKTLGDLAAMAAAAGVGVQEAEDDVEA